MRELCTTCKNPQRCIAFASLSHQCTFIIVTSLTYLNTPSNPSHNSLQLYMYRCSLTSLVFVVPLLHLLIPRISGFFLKTYRGLLSFTSVQFECLHLGYCLRHSCVNFAPLLCIPLVTLKPPEAKFPAPPVYLCIHHPCIT